MKNVHILRYGIQVKKTTIRTVSNLGVSMDKPTIEQVAWVFEKIVENANVKGSYRHLIYDCMGFDPEAYTPLYIAGGMFITNELNGECRIINKIKYKIYKLKIKIQKLRRK